MRTDDTTSPANEHGRNRARGVFALLGCVAVTVCVWGVVLPWYARQPTVKQHLEFLDAQGIDPSAMYYTELEAMDAILDKIENRKHNAD